ncbi:MAG: response regulator [Acidobacteriales bacterium]|nr:response regulator [Terriglobales bacterium]
MTGFGLNEPGDGCVLLVEDSWHDLLLMSYVLDEEGLRGSVHCARSGADAIAFLDRVRRDGGPLICGAMVDLALPDMSGAELVDLMRQDRKFRNLPIVVYSGSTTELNSREKHQLESVTMVEKPIKFKDFQSAFLRLLRSLLNNQCDELAVA